METFSALLAICTGNSPVPGEFPAQRPVTRSFDVFFICVWINGWVNNGEAGDLRRHRGLCDVTVMLPLISHWGRVVNYAIIDLDNGLSPVRRQAIIRTHAGLLLIGPRVPTWFLCAGKDPVGPYVMGM